MRRNTKLKPADVRFARVFVKLRDAIPSRAELARMFNVAQSTLDRAVEEKTHKIPSVPKVLMK